MLGRERGMMGRATPELTAPVVLSAAAADEDSAIVSLIESDKIEKKKKIHVRPDRSRIVARRGDVDAVVTWCLSYGVADQRSSCVEPVSCHSSPPRTFGLPQGGF